MKRLVFLAFIAACSSDPPPPPAMTRIATMQALITVTGDGSQTVADMTILTGDTLMDHYSLATGDSLLAAKGSDSAMLAATGMGMSLHYTATFPGMDVEGTSYSISYTRTSDTSAPHSQAIMPAPLALSMPTDGASFSRSMNDIVVSYAPSGSVDPITWSIEGPCVRATGMQPVTGDSGNFTIGRGGLRDAGPGGTCTATLTVYRTRPGTLDPAFGKGGKVTAIQLGKVSISTKP